jgi:hypothetical protein
LYIELRGDPGLVRFTEHVWAASKTAPAATGPMVVAPKAHGRRRCSVSHTFHASDLKGVEPYIVKHFPVISKLDGEHLTMSVSGNNPHAATVCRIFYGTFW